MHSSCALLLVEEHGIGKKKWTLEVSRVHKLVLDKQVYKPSVKPFLVFLKTQNIEPLSLLHPEFLPVTK